jgi:hypothetical protein
MFMRVVRSRTDRERPLAGGSRRRQVALLAVLTGRMGKRALSRPSISLAAYPQRRCAGADSWAGEARGQGGPSRQGGVGVLADGIVLTSREWPEPPIS